MDTFPFPDVAPDWGLTDNVDARVEKQELGDGYVLMRPKGINYLVDSWNPTWTMLEPQVADEIYDWLRPRLKLTPFLWKHPETNTLHQVTCESLSLARTDYGIAVVSASFVKNFNMVD